MSDFVLPISGEMSVGAALNGEVSIGSVIFNDYIITISDINGGHRLTARRGSDIQTMDILNGVDAPVPDIKITDVEHGHDVTITVGDVAKTFYIHDGVDAPVPEIYVEAVQGGHKVIAAVGETVKSFTVKDGVDGKDGDDAPIPEIKVETISGGHKVTASVGNTVQSFNVMDGKDGKTPVKNVDYFDGKDGYSPVKNKDYFDGKDGISPVINVTDIENGHRVTITTGSNVQSFDVVDGKDGKSAVSPTVSVTEIEGGHRVTINSEGKTDSFDVMNGKDGKDAECGTVEVDPTLSIEGMAADAKATGDAIKAIGSGGGAQVQSDYAQHDATAPDFIKNRPFWPKSTPILLDDTTEYIFGDFASYDEDGIKVYPAPVEGKRYTFCAVGGSVYTGVAVSGEFDLDGEMFPGIGIVDEHGRDALAVHFELGGVASWFVKIPEFVEGSMNFNIIPLVIIEGDSDYTKRSVPDDVFMSADGMNLVFEFKNLAENDNYLQALLNDVEIVVGANGVEYVVAKDDLTILGDASNILDGVMYMYGDTALAMLAPMDETGASIMLALVDGGSASFVKSFKVNYPGIFAPVVEAKKVPSECLPESITDQVVWVDYDHGNNKLKKTAAEIYNLWVSGKTVMCSSTGTPLDYLNDENGEVTGLYVVYPGGLGGSLGNPDGTMYVIFEYFDTEGYQVTSVARKIQTVDP